MGVRRQLGGIARKGAHVECRRRLAGELEIDGRGKPAGGIVRPVMADEDVPGVVVGVTLEEEIGPKGYTRHSRKARAHVSGS
jgi:hypothetical protein